LGLDIRPIDYSLKSAIFHIDTDPGLQIETSYSIELETCAKAYHSLSEKSFSPTSYCVTSHDIRFSEKSNRIDMEATVAQDIEELQTRDGKLAFPDWASNITHSGFFLMLQWTCGNVRSVDQSQIRDSRQLWRYFRVCARSNLTAASAEFGFLIAGYLFGYRVLCMCNRC